MTPSEFRAALADIGWPARLLATRAGYAPSIAQQWACGRSGVPSELASWLECMADAARRVGPLPSRS